jgi:hypothetical protein
MESWRIFNYVGGVVEHLPSNCEALSSNPSNTRRKKQQPKRCNQLPKNIIQFVILQPQGKKNREAIQMEGCLHFDLLSPKEMRHFYTRWHILESYLGSFMNSWLHSQLGIKNLDGKTHCALWAPQSPLPQVRFCKALPAPPAQFLVLCCSTLKIPALPRHKSFFLTALVSSPLTSLFLPPYLQEPTSLCYHSDFLAQIWIRNGKAITLLWIQPNRGTWWS